MKRSERARVRELHQLELLELDYQREQIAALVRATTSLQRSHELLRKMVKLTSSLLGIQ